VPIADLARRTYVFDVDAWKSLSRSNAMPFVRIDLMRGTSAQYRKTLGEIVYKAMVDVINVPKDDKFQVITEHAPEDLNFSESYLGNHYSKDLLFIQITLIGAFYLIRCNLGGYPNSGANKTSAPCKRVRHKWQYLGGILVSRKDLDLVRHSSDPFAINQHLLDGVQASMNINDAGLVRISRSRHGPSRLRLDRKHQRPELVLRRSIPRLCTPLSTPIVLMQPVAPTRTTAITPTPSHARVVVRLQAKRAGAGRQ